MANKAAKQLARTNTATLNRTHLITLTLHTLFVLYHLLYRSGSWRRYLTLTLPALAIEAYLERLGRPKFARASLVSPGEDLDAKGVTEYLWDIVYVTWGVLGIVGVVGEWGWFVWGVIPLYAVYLAVGMYRGLSGFMPAAPEGPLSGGQGQGQSNRQRKAEKRGGQTVRHN